MSYIEIELLKKENQKLKELASDLGRENDCLRFRNEELRDQIEHLEKANLYILRINKNQGNHIADQYKEIEQLKNNLSVYERLAEGIRKEG